MIKNKKTDCEIIGDGFDNVFNHMGTCIDTAFDERKSKVNVVGSIFDLVKSVIKLTWGLGSCAVKNTPKAVVAVAQVKRELVDGIETGINQVQKEMKEDALEQKIKMLKQKW